MNGERYRGEYECPRCGCGSKDLKLEALAIEIRRMGNTVKLACDICGFRFLHTEQPDSVNAGQPQTEATER